MADSSSGRFGPWRDDMPILHIDSQSAIMLAKNLVFHGKTKHIEVKYHFLCQVLEDKRLEQSTYSS